MFLAKESLIATDSSLWTRSNKEYDFDVEVDGRKTRSQNNLTWNPFNNIVCRQLPVNTYYFPGDYREDYRNNPWKNEYQRSAEYSNLYDVVFAQIHARPSVLANSCCNGDIHEALRVCQAPLETQKVKNKPSQVMCRKAWDKLPAEDDDVPRWNLISQTGVGNDATYYQPPVCTCLYAKESPSIEAQSVGTDEEVSLPLLKATLCCVVKHGETLYLNVTSSNKSPTVDASFETESDENHVCARSDTTIVDCMLQNANTSSNWQESSIGNQRTTSSELQEDFIPSSQVKVHQAAPCHDPRTVPIEHGTPTPQCCPTSTAYTTSSSTVTPKVKPYHDPYCPYSHRCVSTGTATRCIRSHCPFFTQHHPDLKVRINPNLERYWTSTNLQGYSAKRPYTPTLPPNHACISNGTSFDCHRPLCPWYLAGTDDANTSKELHVTELRSRSPNFNKAVPNTPPFIDHRCVMNGLAPKCFHTPCPYYHGRTRDNRYTATSTTRASDGAKRLITVDHQNSHSPVPRHSSRSYSSECHDVYLRTPPTIPARIETIETVEPACTDPDSETSYEVKQVSSLDRHSVATTAEPASTGHDALVESMQSSGFKPFCENCSDFPCRHVQTLCSFVNTGLDRETYDYVMRRAVKFTCLGHTDLIRTVSDKTYLVSDYRKCNHDGENVSVENVGVIQVPGSCVETLESAKHSQPCHLPRSASIVHEPSICSRDITYVHDTGASVKEVSSVKTLESASHLQPCSVPRSAFIVHAPSTDVTYFYQSRPSAGRASCVTTPESATPLQPFHLPRSASIAHAPRTASIVQAPRYSTDVTSFHQPKPSVGIVSYVKTLEPDRPSQLRHIQRSACVVRAPSTDVTCFDQSMPSLERLSCVETRESATLAELCHVPSNESRETTRLVPVPRQEAEPLSMPFVVKKSTEGSVITELESSYSVDGQPQEHQVEKYREFERHRCKLQLNTQLTFMNCPTNTKPNVMTKIEWPDAAEVVVLVSLSDEPSIRSRTSKNNQAATSNSENRASTSGDPHLVTTSFELSSVKSPELQPFAKHSYVRSPDLLMEEKRDSDGSTAAEAKEVDDKKSKLLQDMDQVAAEKMQIQAGKRNSINSLSSKSNEKLVKINGPHSPTRPKYARPPSVKLTLSPASRKSKPETYTMGKSNRNGQKHMDEMDHVSSLKSERKTPSLFDERLKLLQGRDQVAAEEAGKTYSIDSRSPKSNEKQVKLSGPGSPSHPGYARPPSVMRELSTAPPNPKSATNTTGISNPNEKEHMNEMDHASSLKSERRTPYLVDVNDPEHLNQPSRSMASKEVFITVKDSYETEELDSFSDSSSIPCFPRPKKNAQPKNTYNIKSCMGLSRKKRAMSDSDEEWS